MLRSFRNKVDRDPYGINKAWLRPFYTMPISMYINFIGKNNNG